MISDGSLDCLKITIARGAKYKMKESFQKMMEGYQEFREKYVLGDNSIMQFLANHGQKPKIMIVACCDSRVDPALILQCDPGDLFVVRNVANIIPPYEKDKAYHGTSAALEFGICYLNVQHLIILGHSQCGGIQALLRNGNIQGDDFISKWVSIIPLPPSEVKNENDYAKQALIHSYQNCLTFPWIKQKTIQKTLQIHLWFFNIEEGEISTYSYEEEIYQPLDKNKSEKCRANVEKEQYF